MCLSMQAKAKACGAGALLWGSIRQFVPDLPVAASGAGSALGVVPGAALAEAFGCFRFDDDGSRLGAGLAPTAPALATGAAFAVDGLAQQVFAALQEAMV